jgi:hypothetical protein
LPETRAFVALVSRPPAKSWEAGMRLSRSRHNQRGVGSRLIFCGKLREEWRPGKFNLDERLAGRGGGWFTVARVIAIQNLDAAVLLQRA